MKNVLFYAALLLGLVGLFTSCVDERFTDDPSCVISFSSDTISFDTLFTTVPSRTASFLVYNHNKKALKISSVRLVGGEQSLFRMNVDGRLPDPSNRVTNIQIKAQDSLFVFVELTINPTEQDAPVYFEDAIEFIVNGVKSEVKLIGYGQDAIIFRGKSWKQDTTLTDNRPYLIFDYIHVAKGATLTLKEGTRLFFHSNANLIVDGNLKSKGTLEKPVLMRGDRFDRMQDVDETPYDYLPAQWGSVYLQAPKGNHEINHTIIRGGEMGVFLVGMGVTYPKLLLKNSQIHTMKQYGIYTQNASLTVENSEISNCGKACMAIIGGESKVVHSTIANYFEWDSREEPAVLITNYILNDNLVYLFPITSSVFENSIIYGNHANEITLQKDTFGSLFNVLLSDCLIKAKKDDRIEYRNITWAPSQNSGEGQSVRDTVFMNTSIQKIKETGYYNFQLAERSIAIGKANRTVSERYPIDRFGKNRLEDMAPDLGAYEK